MNDEGRALLCDQGLLTLSQTQMANTTHDAPFGGSYRYMAPELFQQGASPTKESDIYSFSMCLYHVSHFLELHYSAPQIPVDPVRKCAVRERARLFDQHTLHVIPEATIPRNNRRAVMEISTTMLGAKGEVQTSDAESKLTGQSRILIIVTPA